MQIEGDIDIEDVTLRGGVGVATGARPRFSKEEKEAWAKKNKEVKND